MFMTTHFTVVTVRVGGVWQCVFSPNEFQRKEFVVATYVVVETVA